MPRLSAGAREQHLKMRGILSHIRRPSDIEGYRFVPFGESWTRSDGIIFHGEITTPWKDFHELDAAQRQYERQLLKELQENSVPIADLEAAYQEGVDSVYD